jgi:hypothetical protein
MAEQRIVSTVRLLIICLHIPNASTVYTMMVPFFSLSLASSSRSTQYTAKRCIYYFMHYYQEKTQCQTANQAQTTTERLQLQIYRDPMTADHNAVFPRHMMLPLTHKIWPLTFVVWYRHFNKKKWWSFIVLWTQTSPLRSCTCFPHVAVILYVLVVAVIFYVLVVLTLPLLLWCFY